MAEPRVKLESAVVTGANRGIGLAFVEHLAKLPNPPAWIFAGCRQPEKAKDLQELATSFNSVKVIKLDVTDDNDITSAVQKVGETVGPNGLSLLLNNAGLGDMSGPNYLKEQCREDLMKHFDVNVTSSLLVTQKFQPLLSKHPTKTISVVVNMTSMLGSLTGNPHLGGLYMYPYRTSKAALNMATLCMAEEFKNAGIVVVAIHPGWVETAMGGAGAPLTPSDSVNGCINVITDLTIKKSGKLLDYQGRVMPL